MSEFRRTSPHTTSVMVPMRDGIGLATDIYRPTIDGYLHEEPLPVLLHRTPYDKRSSRFSETAAYFSKAGYVVAVQDVRGRYRSEGMFSKYETEAQDGYDTIEWLARQPYAEPKIGMWGTSYGAHTQADPAKLNPPSLKTILVVMGGISDGWDHKIRNHGAFELGQQMVWAFRQAYLEADDPVVRQALNAEPVEHWMTALPLRKGLSSLRVAPMYEDYLLTMATNADQYHWKGIGTNWLEYHEQTADIPMLLMSGWYDSYAGGIVANYVGLSRLKLGPIKLIMGPWVHGSSLSTHASEVEFGPEATIVGFERNFHVRWYNHYLKGESNDSAADPPVRIFVMGTGDGHRDQNDRLYHGGYWRDEQEWPISSTRFEPYYFQGDGSLSRNLPGGSSSGTTYTFDPRNPVPTMGGSFTGTTVGSTSIPCGALDQREREDIYGCKAPYLPLKSRSDVVVFQTEQLEQEIEVIGSIVVKIYASSTAVDTDFTAKLIDVYPPSVDYPLGFEMNLTDGVIRARYRNSHNCQELMEPGTRYEFTITLFPTANRFKKGHRIRLDISSSNFPRFDVNPNTGEPLGCERRWMVADNTIYHCAEYASHVILPIVQS